MNDMMLTSYRAVIGSQSFRVGPVIGKQDFQIARRFLKTDAITGDGYPFPDPSQERCAPIRI